MFEEEILELTRKWYNYVGQDHHKDKDCHWYVKKVWSYGQEPYFIAYHYGYIFGDWESPKCQSALQAQAALYLHLKNQIQEMLDGDNELIQYLEEHPDEFSLVTIEEVKERIRCLYE